MIQKIAFFSNIGPERILNWMDRHSLTQERAAHTEDGVVGLCGVGDCGCGCRVTPGCGACQRTKNFTQCGYTFSVPRI